MEIDIPAAGGRAFDARAGQRVRIVTPTGGQTADFFAFNAADPGEWLSAGHTWAATRHARPRQGDTFLSRFRRPMLDFAVDAAKGEHDMMIAACDQARYETLGHVGPHASCTDNLRAAMAERGHVVDVVPQPVNFFMNTRIDANGDLVTPPGGLAPGAHVDLVARMDLICVVSSCPFDLDIAGWAINAGDGPAELTVSVT